MWWRRWQTSRSISPNCSSPRVRQQSVSLLGETALLAQHVESGLARLPLNVQTAAEAMKFAGQMGQYTMALVTQVSSGGMISSEDERQLEDMMTACRQLNEHLVQVEERMYAQPLTEGAAPAQENVQSWPAQEGDSAIEYPSLIYDGPFSDGRQQGEAKGLTRRARDKRAGQGGGGALCRRDGGPRARRRGTAAGSLRPSALWPIRPTACSACR